MHPSIEQSIVFTYADDLETASRFFSEIMELDLVVDQGACHIYRLNEKSFLGVCALANRPKEKTAVTITLVTDDVDGWHAFLTAKGVEYVSGPARSERFGIYSSLFQSPHGYRVEIQRFDDPAWHEHRAAPPSDPGDDRPGR